MPSIRVDDMTSASQKGFVGMDSPKPQNFDRLLAAALGVVAAAYLVYGLYAMAVWTPRVLYSDQWRQYLTFLTVDFPANVFLPYNGHRLVLPNLVAWIDAIAFGGEHGLQLFFGWCAVLAAIAVAAFACVRDREVVPLARAAGATLAVFAIIWLGCTRTLAHTGELMHVYPTIAFALGAVACAWRAAVAPSRGGRWLAVALACSFAATNTMGYGLATFVAVIATLVLARAPRRLVAVAVAGLVLAALYYLGSRGSDNVSGSLAIDPLGNLEVAVRWLGAPAGTVAPYIWEENSSYLLPGFAQNTARALSAWMRAHVTADVALSAWPQALTGGLGVLLALVLTWRTLRAVQPPTRMRVFGLGVAWFGLTAAGILSLSRLAYFQEFPEQIYANRYLPWPMLFWLGISLALLGGRHAGRVASRVLAGGALLLVLAAAPAGRGGYITAMLVRGHVDNTAAGVATGVLPRGAFLGDTLVEDVIPAVPVLKAAGHPPFSWRETQALGTVAPSDARAVEGTLEATSVDNLFDGGGYEVKLTLPEGKTPPWRAVLVDGERHVVGIVVRDPRPGPFVMSGYARDTGTPVAALVLP